MSPCNSIKALCDFVVFADDWGRQPSSCQHLMKRFLPENKVYWVNSIGLRSPSFSKYDFWRAVEKIKSWSSAPVNQENNLKVISPISLPWNHKRFVRGLNKSIGLLKLKKRVENNKSVRLVSLATVPNACDWIGNLGYESLKIYYCTDDYSLWPGAHRETVLEMERELFKKIDLFVAASERLYEERKPKGIPSIVLPHAVDASHFLQASKPLLSEKRSFSFPTIAFFGTIDQRLDFELIDYLAQKHSNWTFVFMGPLQYFPKKFRNYKNLEFLPKVDYSSLPEALRAFDVLFLPYHVNSLTQQSNPLKLRECLATGKPVVSVALTETRKYAHFLKIGDSKEDFSACLEKVVKQKSNWNNKKQFEEMAKETWEGQANVLAKKIEEML